MLFYLLQITFSPEIQAMQRAQMMKSILIWSIMLLTLLATLVIIFYFSYWKKRQIRNARDFYLKRRNQPDVMKYLDPFTFELWVQGLFLNLGAEAIMSKRESPKGFDHGIDLIVNYQGQKICIQCKKYVFNNLVDESYVRDLYGVKSAGKFDKAILITTSRFTNRARVWASKIPDLILINGEFLQHIRENNRLLIDLLKK